MHESLKIKNYEKKLGDFKQMWKERFGPSDVSLLYSICTLLSENDVSVNLKDGVYLVRARRRINDDKITEITSKSTNLLKALYEIRKSDFWDHSDEAIKREIENLTGLSR
jgi:hypothetical protein